MRYSSLRLVLLVLLVVAGCATQKSSVETRETAGGWVEETLKGLSLEERVAQMVVPKVFGNYVSIESEEWKRIIHLVRDRKVGGIAIFAGDVFETTLMINRMQGAADVPLLVSADFERGVAMRTRRATAFPEAMAVGATRDPGLAYRMGTIVAAEARALGVHQNLAPVADVNNNPDNPVINTRSYGEDPHWVAEIAAAYARGLQDGGVVATAKHFPGHGDTNTDSHIGLPVLGVSRGRLDSVELLPFRRLVGEGVNAVMVAHIAVPAIDSTILPATLSKRLVTDILKKEMGFEGLVVSDALDMQGPLNSFGLEEIAVRALKAGVDILLVPPIGSEDSMIDAIKNAVMTGQISEEQISGSVRKILRLKKSMDLDKQRMVDPSRVQEIVGAPGHWETAKRIAQLSITVLKNDDVLPLQRVGLKRKILNVIINDNDDYRIEVHRSGAQGSNERVGSYLALQLRRRYPLVESVRMDPRTNPMEFDSILSLAKSADVILCPIYVKARSGSGKFGLPQQIVDWANVLSAQGKPTIFIAMGSPYVLGSMKNGHAYVSAYSDGELSTEAAAEVLFGEVRARGRLPVTVPGSFPLGSGLDVPPARLREEPAAALGFDTTKLRLLDSIMQNALRDSAFPGAQLLVAKDGSIVYKKAFGKLDYSRQGSSVDARTMYDLASLTKVIATTSAVMKLYEEGRLKLDDRVVRYLPKFASGGKEAITIRHLLLHNSGLPAFKQLYLTCRTAVDVLDSVYNSELIYPPGDSTVYSDFGFIVLGRVVESVTGMPLDAYAARTFFQPLGFGRTMFNPPDSLWSGVAPTETDTFWRHFVVRGNVHDETSALLGGVSGHAGLFSSASDLAVFIQMLMNGGFYGNKNFLKRETVKLFTSSQNGNSARALGWDRRASSGYSSAGSLFSKKSFGHTGFTGTSIWVDPERNLFVILLTNRIHPTRENEKIFDVRPAVHDAVINALKTNSFSMLRPQ